MKNNKIELLKLDDDEYMLCLCKVISCIKHFNYISQPRKGLVDFIQGKPEGKNKLNVLGFYFKLAYIFVPPDFEGLLVPLYS